MTAIDKKNYSSKIGAYALYSGRVQGVGFRFTAQRYANETGVFGYVKNLWDGTVEVVVEGEQEKVVSFLERIKSTLAHYIEDVEVNFTPYGEKFKGFNIRF